MINNDTPNEENGAIAEWAHSLTAVALSTSYDHYLELMNKYISSCKCWYCDDYRNDMLDHIDNKLKGYAE
jgi:hypothetical protein